MATRRIISQEKTLLEKDDRIGSSPAASEKSNITPAVPAYASLQPPCSFSSITSPLTLPSILITIIHLHIPPLSCLTILFSHNTYMCPRYDHQANPQPLHSSVIIKLLAFTFAMIVIPISSYFLTVDRLFKGSSSRPPPCCSCPCSPIPYFLSPICHMVLRSFVRIARTGLTQQTNIH